MENSRDDRLSILNDDILLKILSLLPINTVIASTVLSRRWHYLWTHVTAFYLDQDNEPPGRRWSPDLTTRVVNTVLLKLKSPVISTFILHAKLHPHPKSIHSWIRFLCVRNIQNLTIKSCYFVPLILPSFLFQCHSLVSLSTDLGGGSVELPKQINLPNLKKLDVTFLRNSDETFMNNLFKSCPRLEELRVLSHLGHESTVFISGHYLRSLDIQIYSCSNYENVVVYIDAPNLRIFQVADFSDIQFRFTTKPSKLLKAELKCRGIGKLRLLSSSYFMEVFSVISGAPNLTVDESFLNYVFVKQDYELPVFTNLIKLVCSVSSIDIWRNQFLRLLDYTPNLEFLVIDLLFTFFCGKREADNDDQVPLCLVHRVKKMEFEINGILESRNQELELEVVKYMLTHGRALEEVVIKVRCNGVFRNDEHQLRKELELYHLYEILHHLPKTLGLHNCSVTLKFVLYNGIRLVFPHQMEYEEECSLKPKKYFLTPPSILKESLST